VSRFLCCFLLRQHRDELDDEDDVEEEGGREGGREGSEGSYER
jgi:hypothetical protein